MKRTSRIMRYLSPGLLAAVAIAGVARPAQSLDNGGGSPGGGSTRACYACETKLLPFQRVLIAQCVPSTFVGTTECEPYTIYPAGTQSCNMGGSVCVVNSDDGSVYIP